MGIDNMRRWPMYVVFAVCFMLILSLINSWNLETELRNRIAEISTQLQECSKQQTTCMQESLTLLEQKDGYVSKINEIEKQKQSLNEHVTELKAKATKAENQVNHTQVDVELCKTELQSVKNLQLSTSATLTTLRLEKDTLTAQLQQRKQKIEDLEKEVDRLKTQLSVKSVSVANPPPSVKVTPAAQPPKQSPALNVQNAINEPVLEPDNDAKEEMEDTNIVNDGQDFDQQLQ